MLQGIAAMMTALTNIIILGAVIKDKEGFQKPTRILFIMNQIRFR